MKFPLYFTVPGMEQANDGQAGGWMLRFCVRWLRREVENNLN